MDTWVLGASGQLGFHLSETEGSRGLSRDEVDFESSRWLDQLNSLVRESRPRTLFNATAHNKVDLAETDRDNCMRMNCEVPKRLAEWCGENKIKFVHYSTDFVFSGIGGQVWTEQDSTQPCNFYGQSKREGELAVLKANSEALIFRTSWVYSHRRENFILAIMKRAREQKILKVVSDQVGSPTWAKALAYLSAQAVVQDRGAKGIFHLCDGEHVSRSDFARAALEEAGRFNSIYKDVRIEDVLTSSLNSPAQRPLNTRLSLEKFTQTFGLAVQPWRENLKKCLELFYASR